MFQAFFLRFTLRIHILKRASLIRSEKTKLMPVFPTLSSQSDFNGLFVTHKQWLQPTPRPYNSQAFQASNTKSGGSRGNTLP